MKTPSVGRKNGFTLIELLVVITIIAVLAGAGFAAGNAAIQKAKKTTALASINSMEQAVNQFYSEYGTMPVANMDADDTKKSNDQNLLKALLGTEASGSGMLNTRAIKFLSAREGKRKSSGGGSNGLVYDTAGTNVQGLYDPWGGLYYIKFDGDYDDKITGVKTSKDTNSVTLNGKKCAVWSNGADGVSEGSGSPADDVRSWQVP